MNRTPAAITSRVSLGLAAAFLPALCFGAQAAKRGGVPPKLPAAILGVRPGMDLDNAHALLLKQGGAEAADPPKSTPKDRDAEKPSAPGTDKEAARPKPAVPAEDDDEGHQEAWTLRGTPYARVALAADDKGHVLWITGFVRPGQEMPFAQLGDTNLAAATSPSFAVWNVIIPHKLYRVVARGNRGKASVVSMLTLAAANPNGIFSPQIVPSSIVPPARR